MKIIKQELQFEECLKQRLEFICEFAKVPPTFINVSIRKLGKTNLTYIEPHRVIIKNITFLVFNYSNDVYISNLTKKIKLSELEEYLKNIIVADLESSDNTKEIAKKMSKDYEALKVISWKECKEIMDSIDELK